MRVAWFALGALGSAVVTWAHCRWMARAPHGFSGVGSWRDWTWQAADYAPLAAGTLIAVGCGS